MAKKLRTATERLAGYELNKIKRALVMLRAVRKNFTGFEEYNGYFEDYIDRLTPAQDRQLRRYYNTLAKWLEGATVYKLRITELPKQLQTKKGIDDAKRAVQMGEGRSRAKYLFVKHHGASRPKIGVMPNGKVAIVDDHFGYIKEFYEFDAMQLATDLDETMAQLKEETEGALFYRIANSRHEIISMTAQTPRLLADQIIVAQKAYANSWHRWLMGVTVYYTDKPLHKFRDYEKKNRAEYYNELNRKVKQMRAQRRKK